MKKLEDLILTYKDFPKKGIDFKDVLEILQYPEIKGFFVVIFSYALCDIMDTIKQQRGHYF